MDIQAIAKTLGTDTANESVQITLPGAAVEFLLRWAERGIGTLPLGEAGADLLGHLGDIREAADVETVKTSDQFVGVDEFLTRFGPDMTAARDEAAAEERLARLAFDREDDIPEGDGRPFATTLDGSRHYALGRVEGDVLDHGGVWDRNGKSKIGGPDLSGSPADPA